MTNIEDVDLRLTATRNELAEEDSRLQSGLDAERDLRIAGDDSNKQTILQVQENLSGTERRLSSEVIDRAQGDVNTLNSLSAIAQALSDYRIKTDLEIANEQIIRQQLGVDLDTKINNFVASFDHEKHLIYQAIQEVQLDVDGKYSSLDRRIKKYENMLQDITMDSIKITMDNGEINMGVWTILSQAREWDLEIWAKVKDFQTNTTTTVDEALNDFQNNLPVTEDIINSAIEVLSEASVIKNLDEAIKNASSSIVDLQQDFIKEQIDQANSNIYLSQQISDSIAREAENTSAKIQEESQSRIDALQKESATRIKQIADLDDGLTNEVNSRIDGDNVAYDLINNLKASSDTNLANVYQKIAVNTDSINSNASKIDQLDSKVTVAQKDASKALVNAATAQNTANTAVSNTNALSENVALLQASITDINSTLVNKVDATAFNTLKADVTRIDKSVTSNSQAITTLQNNVSSLNSNVTANTQAVGSLTSRVSSAEESITANTQDITNLKATVNNPTTGVVATSSALAALNSRVTATESSITAQGTSITNLTARVSTSRNYTVKSRGKQSSGTAGVVDIDNNNTVYNTTRSWGITVFNADGSVKSHAAYDVFGSTSAATAFNNDVTALATGTYVAVTTFDEPYGNLGSIKNSLLSLGATTAALNQIVYRSAYLLVGKKGAVQGQGIELVTSDITQPIDYSLTLVKGIPSGVGGSGGLANAVTALSNTISDVDGRVTTNSSNITNLQNSVSTINGTLTTKADVAAVNALTTRVTTTENSITANTSDITSLKSVVNNPTTGVAATANALSNLSNTVTQQGQTLNSNSASITALGNAVGGAGINLLPANYSVFNSASAPAFSSSGVTMATSVDVDAYKGYCLTATTTSTSKSATFVMCSASNYATANMPFVAGKYIISYYAKASTDGHVIAAYLRTFTSANEAANSANAVQQALTTSWARYSYVVDASSMAGSRMDLAIQSNRSGVNGVIVSFDKLMVEFVAAGTNPTPSTFVVGQVYDTVVDNYNALLTQTNATSAAISSLDSRVTATENTVTSQSNSITSLNNSINALNQGANLLKDPYFYNKTLWAGNLVGQTVQAAANSDSYVVTANPYPRIGSVTVSGSTSGAYVGDLTSTFSVEAGATYQMSGKIRRYVTNAVGILQTWILWYDNANTLLSNVVVSSEATGATAVSSFLGSGVAPANAVKGMFRLRLACDANGAFKVDNLGIADLRIIRLSNMEVENASAITALTTRVTTAEGAISQNYTSLNTQINNQSSTITQVSKTVDGISALQTVSIDNNGFISGYGLISQQVNGVVISAFGVNADYFYVGTSASNKKKPFMVLTSPQTINGTTYPAGTWIDTAIIANATIGTAHIKDASITNAKVANLDASKITTGVLNANRICVGSTSTFDEGYNPTTKARTFVSQPTVPYSEGDIWKNGSSIKVCTTTRNSGSFVAADWTLAGDVTSANTAANANQLGGTPAATINTNIANADAKAVAADNKATTAQATANSANNQVNAWKFTGTTEIDGGKIRADTITAAQLSVNELSAISANLGTIQVGSANIADAAVTSAKIGDLAVNTLKIADRAVTAPLIAILYPSYSASPAAPLDVKFALGAFTGFSTTAQLSTILSMNAVFESNTGGFTLYIYIGDQLLTTVDSKQSLAGTYPDGTLIYADSVGWNNEARFGSVSMQAAMQSGTQYVRIRSAPIGTGRSNSVSANIKQISVELIEYKK